VRASLVVMLDIASPDANEPVSTDDQEMVKASRRTVPTQRSATAFLGARTGVQMISAPVERHTSPTTLVNLLSRSRIRNPHATA
jgi:hypothetical protein